MLKGIKITVSSPCLEQWQQMQPVENGRYCGTCQKTVVDFTNMTNQELLAYFGNHTGDVCGRFSFSQTDVAIVPVHQKKVTSKTLVFFAAVRNITAGLAAFLFGFGVKAQISQSAGVKPFTEITPIQPKPITVNSNPVKPPDMRPEIGSDVQGLLGGVCVSPVVIEEENKWKDRVMGRIEDILRLF